MRVLVIGGYGFFGQRLAQLLAGVAGLEVVIAGRSAERAEALARRLGDAAAARVRATASLDVTAPDLPLRLRQEAPDVVVLTSGPFQDQDHRVARACIATGRHYLDLADSRAFVTGIGDLNAEAAAAGVTVISGASSVPGLSSAAADRLCDGLLDVRRIDIGISPGNRTERGLATVQAILSYCGRRLPDVAGQPVFGWSGSWVETYPAPVGRRLLSPCDVPDLALLPGRYPGRPTVRFGAGLELHFLHRGMNLLAGLGRRGIVQDLSRHAAGLKWIADLFRTWGSNHGAMHVRVVGIDAHGVTVTRHWCLTATEGDGPFVPTLAACALIRKFQRGTALPRGAFPCVGLLTLEDFEAEAAGRHIAFGKPSDA